jgi:hypothetical protein
MTLTLSNQIKSNQIKSNQIKRVYPVYLVSRGMMVALPPDVRARHDTHAAHAAVARRVVTPL